MARKNYRDIPDGLRSRSRATQRDFDFLPRLVGNDDVFLGTRHPEIHSFARELAKTEAPEEIALSIVANWNYHEEKLLAADLLGMVKDIGVQLALLDELLPLVDSWDVCDSLVCRLRPMVRKNREHYWEKCELELQSSNPWRMRFALVLAMEYSKTPGCYEIVETTLKKLDGTILEENCYLRMGIAWSLSMFYLTSPEQVLSFVGDNRYLDRWTRRKTITKVLESRQVDATLKSDLRRFRGTL